MKDVDKPQAAAPDPSSVEPGLPARLRFADFTKLPLIMVAVMFLAAAIVYPYMPARFPTHWGPSGVADGWSTKSFMSVFFEPILALGLYGLLIVIPMVDPKRANIAKSIRAYNIVLDAVIGLQLVVFGATTMAAFKPGFDVTRIILLAMGALFLVLGNVMQDVKQNFTMGVRVSWTLADDVVWEKTNRLGGRLFMGAGAVTLVAAFVPAPWGILGMLATVLGMLPVLMTYSYLLYRKRHPEA